MLRTFLATILVVTACSASAGTFDLTWHTIDAGGDMYCIGGSPAAFYEVSGTIGQPDAGRLSGGGFELIGGFWPAADHPGVLGDMNCDGVANVLDINWFVLALLDPPAYAMQFPGCNILHGDIDGDGRVSVLDINPYVDLLLGR